MGEKITFSDNGRSFTVDDDWFFCECTAGIGWVECQRLARKIGYENLAAFKRKASQLFPDTSPLNDRHYTRSIWMAEELLKAIREHVRTSS